MANVGVIGCGYVGAVSAACLAELGHDVECIDIDRERINLLRSGRSPIYEPGLEEILVRGLRAGRLAFSSDYPDQFRASIVFIAVNTPGSQEGAADLRAVRDAVAQVAPRLQTGSIIVNKSTVPIGTGDLVEGVARRCGARDVSVVSNPEFLREGSAVGDFLHPDRIILGSNDSTAIDRVEALYAGLDAPVQRVDIRTAEMIKYASNAFLATKISFINEMAAICEALGADVADVAAGMGLDVRIGAQFLHAGLGWGGSCFPKDVRALAHMAAVHGAHPQLLRSVMEINNEQRLRTVRKLRNAVGDLDGKRILILGAAFKASTDDTRNSPAIELASLLQLEGAHVAIYDPVVTAEAILRLQPGIEVVSSVADGARGSHGIVLATDWPEFLELDFGILRQLVARPVMIDGRNCLDPATVTRAGFAYDCIGRPRAAAGAIHRAAAGPELAVGGASWQPR